MINVAADAIYRSNPFFLMLPCCKVHISVRQPTATLLQVSMITRWQILYVLDHFSGIHFTSAQGKKKNKKTPI